MKFKLDSLFSYYANGKQLLQVKGSTVSDCLDNLTRQFPRLKELLFTRDGSLSYRITLLLNGKDMDHEMLDKPVKNTDEVKIFYSGGG